MARALYSKDQGDGTTSFVYDDGHVEIWNVAQGTRLSQTDPNPDLANAFNSGDSATIQQLTNEQAAEAGKELIRQFNVGASQAATNARNQNAYQMGSLGVAKTQAATGQYNAETGRFTAQTGRMSAEAQIAELERRFGLDQQRAGIDYIDKATQYAKTPQSWLDSANWQAGVSQQGAVPVFLQRLQQGVAGPAFNSKGAGTPAMNSVTNLMAQNGITSGVADPAAQTQGAIANAAGQYDSGKALQQILKASPPSGTPGLTGQDLATINLVTQLYKRGAQGLQEGTLESLSPDQLGILQGTMDYIAPNGYANYTRDYGQSRIPTQSSAYSA